jgi:hypothetical protein
METFTYQRVLPSCTLHRALLAAIEKKLLLGIPILMHDGLRKITKRLGLEDHKKLEHYMIMVESKKQNMSYKCAKELPSPYFERQPKQVKVEYLLCASKFIAVEIVFSINQRPRVRMTTQSPIVQKMLPKVADTLCESIAAYGNRHKVLHSPFVQSLLLLTTPILVMAYGIYCEIDAFMLYSSMGWLCLLSLGLVKSLPQLFPWVTFETKRRFKLNRIPLLAKFSLISVVVACYIALILLYMPRASSSEAVMLASFFG